MSVDCPTDRDPEMAEVELQQDMEVTSEVELQQDTEVTSDTTQDSDQSSSDGETHTTMSGKHILLGFLVSFSIFSLSF